MHKIWLVTKFETLRQLKKPTFWIALLFLPLMIIGFAGLSSFSSGSFGRELAMNSRKTNDNIIGFTDKSNTISDAVLTEKILKITSKEEGISRLKNGEISEYYYIPEDFSETKKVESYALEAEEKTLFTQSSGNITALLMSSAMTRVNPNDVAILTNQIKVENTTFSKTGEQTNLLGKAIAPIAILAIFYILICVFGNRMPMAVVEEKENRISEMILTAVSAKELMIGKIIALILLGLLQITVFVVPVLCLVFLNRENPMISNALSLIEFEPISIIANLTLLVFSYILFTGVSVLVGSMMPTARDASQYMAVVMISLMLPFFFLSEVTSTNATMLTYGLSYFPLSAPIAMMLRNAFGLLPWYEFALGLIEIGLFAVLSIFLAAKSFQKNAINFSLPKIRLRRAK